MIVWETRPIPGRVFLFKLYTMNDNRKYNATSNRVKVQKNPFGPRLAEMLFRAVTISVRRFYTDIDGVILDKTDVLIPANMKVKYPVFMFGTFDMLSGFRAGSNVCPPLLGVNYLTSFVNGFPSTSYSVLGITGLNQIQGQLSLGDIVHVFCDDIQNPSYFCWIVQSSNALSGLSSIMNNLMTTQNDNRLGRLFVYEFLLNNSDREQWKQAINFTVFDNLGNYANDVVNPLMFRGPFTELDNLIRLETEFLCDQYLGINTYIDYGTDVLSYDFNIKKID